MNMPAKQRKFSRRNPVEEDTAVSFSPLSSSYMVEGGLDLGQLLETLRRRGLLIAGVTAIFTAGTLFWSTTRPPSYISSFQILVEAVTVESEVVSSVTGSQKDVTDQDFGVSQLNKTGLDYATQIEILLSRQLLEPVVQDLSSRFPRFTFEELRKKLTISRFSSSGQAAKGNTATKILRVVYQSGSPEETQAVVDSLANVYLDYSLTERQTNLKRAIQFADQQLPFLNSRVNNLESEIQKFREVNQILDPDQSIEQVSQQLNSIESTLRTAQINLSAKRQEYESLQQQLNLQPDGAEAGSVLSEAPEYRRLVEELQQVESALAISSGELAESHPDVISLREKRDRLRPLVQQASQNVLGNKLANSIGDPTTIPFQTALRRSLSEQLIATSIELKNLEVQNTMLLQGKRSLEQKVIRLPEISKQYNNLLRQLKIASDTLERFLEKRQDLSINAARQEIPWELIEPPQAATAAILTSLPRDISLGAFLGILAGVGIAILLDKNSGVIRSLQELRESVNLPILGIIPVEPGLENVAFDLHHNLGNISAGIETPLSSILEFANDYSFSFFLESFKSLYIQLRLLHFEGGVASVVVSSIKPSEGKSTVAIHLAEAASKMGKRVLIVDCDLRLPDLHTRLGLQKEPGLVDLLALDNFVIGDVVQSLSNNPNFCLLASGTQTNDSTSILSSTQMQELMLQVHESFDLVIYDSPPLGLADAAILSSLTDGLLLVSKMGETNRNLLREKLHSLEVASIPILGVVANGVKDQRATLTQYEKYTERVNNL